MAIEIRTTKDGQKSYRAVLYRSRRKLATKSFKRKHDALKWLEEKEMQLRLGKSGRMLFADAVSIWLENHASLKLQQSSIQIRLYRLKKTITPFFEKQYLDDITPEDIDRFVLHLKKMPAIRKNSTVNDYLKIISAVFGYFVKRRYLAHNPVCLVERLPQENLTIPYLSFDEKEVFLRHAEQKYRQDWRWVYVVYLTFLSTGLRWGELAALQWDRADLERRIITVSRTHCKETRVIRERTKSGAIRHVGINSELYPEILSLYHKRKRECPLVFSSQSGNVLDLANFKRSHFEKDLRECGLRHFRIHDLRHSFASHFVMLGGDLYKLQALLGHHSVMMTQHYAHLSPASFVGETELLVQDENRQRMNGSFKNLPRPHPICTPRTKKHLTLLS